MSAFIRTLAMENTAIILLSLLNALIVLFALKFDRQVYLPFLRKMDIQPARLTEFNPHLLPLGLVVAACSILFYAVIGCIWLAIRMI